MSDNADPGPPPVAPATPRPECLCMGLGPELSQLLRHLAPSDEALQRLHAAELEVLKSVRALVDDRIRALSRKPEQGTRVTIE